MSSGAGVVSTPQKEESTFRKTITLLDWWLVKSQDGNKTGISVSGITSAQKQVVRVFLSGPIAKRFDVFTLETEDGVSVILKGVINTQKSIDNGFPTQVVKMFCLGFPENWQQCALETKLESPASDPLQNAKESPVPYKKRTRSKTSVSQNTDDKPKDAPQGDAKQKSTAGKTAKRISAGTVRQNSANTPRNKIKKKIIFEEQATSRSQQPEKYVLPPESLSVGRSRSGRILLPTLEFWRNQIPVYEMDRTVSGIWEERSVPVPERGSRSEPRKRCRQGR